MAGERTRKKEIQTEVTKLDTQTGDVTVQRTSTKISVLKAPHFNWLFNEGVSHLQKLTHAPLRVFLALGTRSEYGTNKVQLTTELRKRLLTDLGMPPGTFSNSIKSLKDAGLITHIDGCITLSPFILWRGDNKELHSARERWKEPPG